jgi:hypothetical protein
MIIVDWAKKRQNPEGVALLSGHPSGVLKHLWVDFSIILSPLWG